MTEIGVAKAHWGERVRARRQLLGMSQRALAEACGLRQGAICFIEAGTNTPRDETKVKIAAALRTTPGKLFSWDA